MNLGGDINVHTTEAMEKQTICTKIMGNSKAELRGKCVALKYGSRNVKIKELSTYLNESR